MPAALGSPLHPLHVFHSWLLLWLLAVSVDLIKSNMKARPTSRVTELSSRCNIWAGTGGCWVPLETDGCRAAAVVSTGARSCFPCSEGGRPTASRVSTTAGERNPERKMLITYFDLVALEMASPTLATIQDRSPGPELLLDKEECLGLLLCLPG